MSRTCPDCNNTYDDDILHCPEDGLSLGTLPVVDELVGRVVGSYTVVKQLGKGGMGAVYMGVHPVIGSRVAIKFLHPEYAHDEKIVDRFFNEARAVNVIGHDNILKIIDLNVTEDNRHYFVMEFLQGRALQNLIKHNVAMPLDVAGPIVIQICEALEAAHRKGIIHRDLKPDNVYLISHKGKKNFVKVVDFGIAKLGEGLGVSTGKTQTGMVMGTPAYMSPEQGGGQTSKVDDRSDVYSLGIMMFQLATGKLPFPGQSFGEVLVGHLQQKPPLPRSINAEIPEEYEQIILKCLEKNQDDRYSSMKELSQAVVACMERLGLSRELPDEDETDAELAPVSPGPRTPSIPGRSTKPAARSSSPGLRNSNPPLRPSSPGLRNSNPALRNSNPNRSGPPRNPSSPPRQPAVAPAPKSSVPLVAGIVAALLVVGGAVVFVVRSSSQRSERAIAAAEVAATRTAARAERAATAKKETDDENALIFLSVVSDPLDAEVQASWKNGDKAGTAPLAIEVPKNVKVHFEFKKAGFLPYTTEIIADQSQTVTARLSPEPTAVADKPRRRTREPREEKKADLPATKDGLIDLNDALK